MKAILSAAAVAACLIATPALAAPQTLYGTLGVTRIDADQGLGFTAVTARAGTRFVKYIGAEVEFTQGFGSSKASDGTKVSLRHDYAVYMVNALPITDNVDVYARLGYGVTKISSKALLGTDSLEGVRYGAGIQAYFDDANGVRVDYTRLDNNDVNADTYSVSYVRKFF
jgi:hypothetical protein